ncbi:hypothetical protein DMB90_13620 [Raoultella planticola]|uniref:Uncharacterized protein n=1 Tax=Raoultella planticola TaxID=575 RepID=A0A5P6AA15_RAOPL|nr:hypothetical protein DMB90_13620 [Raoultella planticola]
MMLLARNGFEFESTRAISAGFFLPALADRRSATGQTESRAENRTDFIPISAKALMPLAAGVTHPSLGYRWLSREHLSGADYLPLPDNVTAQMSCAIAGCVKPIGLSLHVLPRRVYSPLFQWQDVEGSKIFHLPVIRSYM